MTLAKGVERHRRFTKHYKLRIAPNQKLVRQFEQRLTQLLAGRGDLVKDHPLTGSLSGKRAFWVTGDVRVVYVEADTAYILYDIGTHNQVYR